MSGTCNRNIGTFIRTAALTLASLLIFAGGASATVTTFQDGVSNGGTYNGTQDTDINGHVNNGTADSNDGTAATLQVFDREPSTVNIIRSLIRFTLNPLTASDIVGSASLTLTYTGGVSLSTNPAGFQVGAVTNSLFIVDSSDAAWTETSATWNNAVKSTPVAWTGGPGLVAGTDYGAVVATAVSPNTGPTPNLTMTFTLNAIGIAAINDWIQHPSHNAGFIITQPTSSDSIDIFASSENSNASFHPLLTVDTLPEPASLGILSIGGALLLRRRSHR